MSEPLLIGGIPVLKRSTLKTVPAAGIYIDELRISRVIRYGMWKYNPSPKAFTSDTDTLGLYHFDGESTEHYADESSYQISLIRSEKTVESKSDR